MASQLTATGASLLYRSGAEKNYPLPDQSEIRVGFESSNDVVVSFEGVSRRHAVISFDGKGYWIEDAGSSNQTFLNGHRVAKRERLEHLDVVTLGRRTELIFVRKRVSSRVTRRGVSRAWLERLDGLEAGEKREIPRGSLTIGRSSSNNIQTDSQLVSKVHARLERTPTQLILTDLHSANGTVVDGRRIETCVLKDGDEFILGGARSYRVHVEEGEIQMNAGETPSSPSAFDNPVLPTDWKTRIEWSTEERALLEIARSGGASAHMTAHMTATRTATADPAASPASVSAAAPPRPPSAPEKPPASADRPASSAAAAGPGKPLPAPVRIGPAAPQAAPPAVEKRPPAVESQPTPAAPAVPAGDSPPRAFLEGDGKVLPLRIGVHEVGRLPPSTIQIDHAQVSRRHAIIRVAEREIVVEDAGSSNGTFVNGERIRGPRVLTGGEVVAFGDVRFKVRIAGAP